jgi:CheY-like chemotaxis protein
MIVDNIVAEDLFSSHMLSNDSLLFSKWPSIGQGLTAVKLSMQSIGGSCGWRRHESSGVVFWVEMPCLFDGDAVAASADLTHVRHTPNSVPPITILPALVGKKVLLLDSNTLHRNVMRDELMRRGVESVEVAGDGSHGLQLIRQLTFDVVILDLVLPVLNGIECLRELAGDQAAGLHVPLMFGMSNAAEAEDISSASSLGMRAFFNKPVDVDDMCTVMCRQFEKMRAISEPQDRPPTTTAAPSDTARILHSGSRPASASVDSPGEGLAVRKAHRLIRLGRGIRKMFGSLLLRFRRSADRPENAPEAPELSQESTSALL